MRPFSRRQNPDVLERTIQECIDDFETHLHSSLPMQEVRYRLDHDAETSEDRKKCRLPQTSLISPLFGNQLARTPSRIAGIHWPYGYESGSAVSAPFSIHGEDGELHSLQHLHSGQKIWACVPPSHERRCEELLMEDLGASTERCGQVARHTKAFPLRSWLKEHNIPVVFHRQRHNTILVTLPGTLHFGLLNGYSLGEAINFAATDWNLTGYVDCDKSNKLCRPYFRGDDGVITKAMLDPIPSPPGHQLPPPEWTCNEKIVWIFKRFHDVLLSSCKDIPVPAIDTFLADNEIDHDLFATLFNYIATEAGYENGPELLVFPTTGESLAVLIPPSKVMSLTIICPRRLDAPTLKQNAATYVCKE